MRPSRDRLCERPPAINDIAYGQERLQRLSFWGAASKADRPAPLILFVHGGGWKRGDRVTATGRAKVSHFRAKGYGFATMNYRLVPAATVEQLGIDPAFGNDPGRQRAHSPTWQAAAPNAPAFLLLHVQRLVGIAQARGLARALQRAGPTTPRPGWWMAG